MLCWGAVSIYWAVDVDIRRRNLAVLVGSRYFQYLLQEKRRGFSEILERLLKRADEKALRLLVDIITAEAVKIALKVLKNAVLNARRDIAVYREFGVVYSHELIGVLDVARTSTLWGSRLLASLTYLPSLNAPEYFLLRNIAVRSLKLAGFIAGDDREVMHAIKEVEKLTRKLPKGSTMLSCGDVLHISWLRDGCLVLRFLKTLYKKGMRIGRVDRAGEKTVVLTDWKLYEIYIYYLLYEILESFGFKGTECPLGSEADLCLTDGRQNIEVYFNKPAPHSIVLKYNGVQADSVRGRPDAIIRSNVINLIVEAKFSTDPGYITAGRFKAMAYMYEYSANAGVVVFPAVDDGAKDEEDKSTVVLYKYMEANDGVVAIRLQHGKSVFLVRIDPGECETPSASDEAASRRLLKVLREVVKSGV